RGDASPDYPRSPGVARDVGLELLFGAVLPLAQVDELAGRLVEGGDWEARARLPHLADLPVAVDEARVRKRQALEEALGGLDRIFHVHAEERDFGAVLHRGALEVRELEAARAAPRGPGVDDRGGS